MTMGSDRQAGGQVWVSYSDCDKHICTEGGPCKVCRITKLETQIKAVKNCKRYSTYYTNKPFILIEDINKILEQNDSSK